MTVVSEKDLWELVHGSRYYDWHARKTPSCYRILLHVMVASQTLADNIMKLYRGL